MITSEGSLREAAGYGTLTVQADPVLDARAEIDQPPVVTVVSVVFVICSEPALVLSNCCVSAAGIVNVPADAFDLHTTLKLWPPTS